MSLEDRALKALRALVKEIKPGGRVGQASKELKERAERVGVRLMDEVVSMIAQRRVRTHGRKPWEAPEQLEAPRDPRSWRERVGERIEDTVGAILHPEDVVGAVHGRSERPHTNWEPEPAAPATPASAASPAIADRGAAKEDEAEPEARAAALAPATTTAREPAPVAPAAPAPASPAPASPAPAISLEPAIEATSPRDPRIEASASPEPLVEAAAARAAAEDEAPAEAHEDITWREAGTVTTSLSLSTDVPVAVDELPGVTTTKPRPLTAEELEPDDAMTAPLPATYAGDRLVFVARDPEWAHAYWSIQLSRVHDALAQLGGGRGVLRLYDAETNVPLFEVETWAERGRFDLRVPWADHGYRVELCVAHEGRLVVLERSRVVTMPPAMPRPDGPVVFTTMDAQRAVLERAHDLARPPRLELRHELPRGPRSRFDRAAAMAVSVSAGPDAFAVKPLGDAPVEARPAAPFWRPGASEQLHDQRARTEEAAPSRSAAAARAGGAPLGASELHLFGASERSLGSLEALTSSWLSRS